MRELSVRGIHLGKGELWALLAALTYALNNVFTGAAVHGHDLNYLVGVTLRALPTLVISCVVGWGLRRRPRPAVSPVGDWRLALALLGNSLLTFVIAGPLQFAALQAGGVVITSPITGTQVLWGALVAAIFLHEALNRRMVLGIVVTILGIAFLAWGKSGGVVLSARWWLAIPYATATALCWSLAGVLITYAMRRGVDRFQALALAVCISLACLNVYLLVSGDIIAYKTTPRQLLLSVFIAGIFGAVALISITSAMAFTSIASANSINSLQVALAPLIAWAFVGEHMNVPMVLGILLILVGVVVVQRARLVGGGETGRQVDE